MKRWHQEILITRRNWRNHRRIHVQRNIDYQKVIGADPFEVDCVCDDQIGRFRKIDAFDCGVPQCFMCHGDKYPKRFKTYQEWAADLKLKEGIEDLPQNMR